MYMYTCMPIQSLVFFFPLLSLALENEPQNDRTDTSPENQTVVTVDGTLRQQFNVLPLDGTITLRIPPTRLLPVTQQKRI